MKNTILLFAFIVFSTFTYGQISESKNIIIQGSVIDSLTQQPIEFATISFQNKKDIVGTTTDINGFFKFTIATGIYTIKIQFLSYIPQLIVDKEIQTDLNMGIIQLVAHAENLDEVNIVAETNLVLFKSDKKVYNASKDIANKGGTAIDVLNNTPSVIVEIDGSISMRGSNNVTVLIDGKPQFGLERGTDMLRAIPANSIDKVELITQSAKYSARGGGLLNIVTKKRKGSGLSGSIDAHLGVPNDNGLSAFLNENSEKINIFSTISFNNKEEIIRTTIDQAYFDLIGNPEGIFEQIRKDENQRNSFLFNIGSDFYIDKNNTLTTSFLLNTNNKNFNSNLDLDDFDAAHSLTRSAHRNVMDIDETSTMELFLNYTSKFLKEGHQLSFDFKFDNTVSENAADILENATSPVFENIIQKVAKNQNLDNFLFQLDYALPLSETKKIELGYKGVFKSYKNDFNVSQFDKSLLYFVTVGGFNDVINYDENVNAVYGLFTATKGKFSYSFGLRAEKSNITVQNGFSLNTINKNYTDIFPSASLGFELGGGSYLSSSYSRSISRPHVSQLNPFISFNNERFQSVGNPDLNPNYSDYFELLFDKYFHKISIISALFVNYSKDQFLSVIENIGENEEGLELFRRMPINSGDKKIIGMDVDLTYNPFKGLRLNTYLSPYNLDLSNTVNNLYDYNSWVLYSEVHALLSFDNGLRLKASYLRQSPVKDGQTKLGTINTANLSISKDLFEKKASLTFKIIDIFKSKWFPTQSYEANSYTLRRVKYDQQFNLSFTYQFNQKSRSIKDRSRDINKDELEDKQDKKI